MQDETFRNVNTTTSTLYFSTSHYVVVSTSGYLSNAMVHPSDMTVEEDLGFDYAAMQNAAEEVWGGVFNTHRIANPTHNPNAAGVYTTSRNRNGRTEHKAVAYSNSRYYTVASQPQQTAKTFAYTTYRPMLYHVGSEQVAQMGYTTEDLAYASRRKASGRSALDPGLSDPGRDTASPVGEAWALLCIALCYGLVQIVRRQTVLRETIAQRLLRHAHKHIQ